MLGVVEAAQWLDDAMPSARCARSKLRSLDELRLDARTEIPTRFDCFRQDEGPIVCEMDELGVWAKYARRVAEG